MSDVGGWEGARVVTGPSRRRILQLFGSSAAVAVVGLEDAVAAQPATGLRLRTIAVDTSRLIALGSPQMADVVAQSLAPELKRTFGDLVASGDAAASVLVVRITSLSLSDYVGDRSYGGRDGSKNVDYLEGSGVVTSGGRIVSETPVLSALDAGYSGPWYLPGIDERRIQAITQHFAYWLRREMGV